MTATAPIAGARVIGAHRKRALTLALALLCALLVALSLASVVLGARDVGFDEILSALAGNTETIGDAAVSKRLPRTALALLVGAALALAGTALQAVTRNPLADSGILGISSGASFAVVLGIVFFGLSQPYSVIGVAVLGAAATAVFVYIVGSLGGMSPLKLALAGAATAAALSSITAVVMLPRVNQLRNFQFWQIGGVGGASWDRILTVAPALVAGALIVGFCAKALNNLSLGDELAMGLGTSVLRTRSIAALGAVILAGAATAVAGPIGFVGLVVPHMCRLLAGSDHRWLLPLSGLAGAALLLTADIVGRVVARPSELEVGIVTAVIGAPVFVAIVRRQRGQTL